MHKGTHLHKWSNMHEENFVLGLLFTKGHFCMKTFLYGVNFARKVTFAQSHLCTKSQVCTKTLLHSINIYSQYYILNEVTIYYYKFLLYN